MNLIGVALPILFSIILLINTYCCIYGEIDDEEEGNRKQEERKTDENVEIEMKEAQRIEDEANTKKVQEKMYSH